MNSHILSNAQIVTPQENFSGSVVIENGIIAEIVKGKNYADGENLGGLWLTPGCIDIHSDYLEREIHPRANANFPLPMAFHFMDQRAAACGITTVYSAISFSENENTKRSFSNALERAEALDELRKTSLVNHYLHARLDPNTDAVMQYLERMKAIESLRLVVYNESIPGQRQFRFEDLVEKRARMREMPIEETRQMLLDEIEVLQQINHRPEIQAIFEGYTPLGSHDDTTLAHVEEASLFGATLSEMPTTLEAARKAKALGMDVCMGAPNYVRGGSHCGNLSCHEAIAENLVDMLCSDYHFPTMFTAVIKMMQDGISPSQAINYVSLNPARFLQVDDRKGSIEVGKEADLVAFEVQDEYAKIAKVWVNGYHKYAADPVTIKKKKGALINAGLV